ncbi:unnamed protein product [Owenia fusiformis]|uniref:Uncharacterized protein n=1 Tax=Owenia fusiformis TaxID=6347 RepID=A0A8J1UMZ3_OWEFU|nr:unnamed protein product [Owenia fusiformis]
MKVFLMFLLMLSISCSDGARILLTPLDAGYNSRVTNLLTLGRILQGVGHNISVLCSDQMQHQPLLKTVEGDRFTEEFNVITYQTKPETRSTANKEWLLSYIGLTMTECMATFSPLFPEIMELALQDEELWSILETSDFELIVTDDHTLIARILGDHFNIPVISYINWGPMTPLSNNIFPLNPAYVPASTYYSDTMTFAQRLMNVKEYLHLRWVAYNMMSIGKNICLKYKHVNSKSCENIENFSETVSLVFVNRNNMLHYPQPFMPHVVSIDGFTLKQPSKLDTFYNDIFKKAGHNGVIIASFGSLFRNLPMQMAEMFAEAFSAMPQQVIWSYEGLAPKSLGVNTIVRPWIPQNDLLGHPDVKLFIHHCGLLSTYQAVQHAVLTINIPFFLDQGYNSEKITNRIQSGRSVDILGLTSETLIQEMQEVIRNSTYKEKAKAAAEIFNDRPIEAEATVKYWVNYILRHKGAPHLRSQGLHQLNWFQYLLLDIIGFIVLMVVLGVLGVALMIKCIHRTLFINNIFHVKQKQS